MLTTKGSNRFQRRVIVAYWTGLALAVCSSPAPMGQLSKGDVRLFNPAASPSEIAIAGETIRDR